MCKIVKKVNVFETFKVEEKIEELKKLAKARNLDVLDGINVVIAVPSLDESGRSIFLEDKTLFDAQKRDAYKLAEFILGDTMSCMVDVVLDADKRIDVPKVTVDYVIFLHEFMDHERDLILEEFGTLHGKIPKAIELY